MPKLGKKTYAYTKAGQAAYERAKKKKKTTRAGSLQRATTTERAAYERAKARKRPKRGAKKKK